MIRPQFFSPTGRQAANSFSEDKACVKLRDQWGFVNPQGKVVIPPKFVQGGNFLSGLAQVCDTASHCGYINGSGQYVWSGDR